ncbi:hypothetical protein MGYG_06174 [Nannizzia gypsea CBS 118893]|uniref:Uncharacterized protein n=1 Tax=Arthroderma gypseum (strain ATCC MYA-4604 / CBS 118893) TaxID=535722 RepID=E4V0P1_ARTGP|nr:hypothetical protein MGYG_06174 [Nannizzia gypsea CBS 118893]EFR03178.1 hypothetical protein MGYG_06174 [Nannizzia gypsea CBS 118893]
MTSVPAAAMEEEDAGRRPNPNTPEANWALIEDLFPSGFNRLDVPSRRYRGYASDASTYGGSEAAGEGDRALSFDTMSSTSETPSLLTPPLTNTDDEDFEEVEDEDEYEGDEESSIATPSGWGSTQGSIDNEYDQDIYEHEESGDEGRRIYSRLVVLQHGDYEAFSEESALFDHPDIFEHPDAQESYLYDEEMPRERNAEAPSATSPENAPSSGGLTKRQADILIEAIGTMTHQNEVISALTCLSRSRPAYTQPDTIPRQAEPRKEEEPQKEDPKMEEQQNSPTEYLKNKLRLIMEEHPGIYPVLVALLIVSALATILMLPFAGYIFGLSSQVQVGAVTGRVQTIITPVATPVMCAKPPVLSTSPEGVQYLESHSRAAQNMDDFISQLTCAKAQSMNESDDVQVHVVGDHHAIVRLPNRLVSVRDGNRFDIKVTRDDNSLHFDLYKLFDGIFTLRLAPEDAYGPMNVTVSALSKPKLTKVTGIDFGTPWLKIASWKKATQSLSQALRKDLADAQTGLSRVYIKLTFDFRNLYSAWTANTNNTAADTNANISETLDRAANRARNAVAKSKLASDCILNNGRKSLRLSSEKLRARAKRVRQKVKTSVSSMMSAAQERAWNLQTPAFNFDLKTRLRNFRRGPTSST